MTARQGDGLPRLGWALLLVVVFHGGLLIAGSYRGTYDAYVHIFLADHYDRSWFSTWDQRWYTGFTTVSYPPGSHMAIASVHRIIGNLEYSFAVVQLAALVMLTVGVYRYSKLWVDERAAGTAALLLALSSSLAEVVHVYGQLPTTLSLSFLLNSIPSNERWVRHGRVRDLAAGLAVLAACTAGHHVTTLFGSVFFLGPVLVQTLLDRSRRPLADEQHPAGAIYPRRWSTVGPLLALRLRRIGGPLLRLGVLGVGVLVALILVVWPYWHWSFRDPIVQIAIPHGSRDDFLAVPSSGLMFFVIPWGVLLLMVPYAVVRACLAGKWPIGASIALLFVLGTGGTTPVPKLLLGPAFDVLTLDRFTFWGSIQILPLAGAFVASMQKGSIASWLRSTGGALLLRVAQAALAIAVVSAAVVTSSLSSLRPFQPDPIDPAPIVDFLGKDQHERWRYLTLGFGDQMAWLSAQTEATQVDGNYHSVRRLPELTTTSIERLEGAKYRGVDGLGSLQQFLGVPERYNLKYVFSADEFYDPLLWFMGWHRVLRLGNGVMVWERPDVLPLPAELPVREIPEVERLMWGLLPPTTIVVALLILASFVACSFRACPEPAGLRPRRVRTRLLRRVDRSLARRAATLEAATAGEMSQSPPLLVHVRQWAARRPRRTGLILRWGIGLGLAVTIIWATRSESTPPPPEEVVTAYLDDLDFRRWGQAYERIDPLDRPGEELWQLQRSVSGGLLASYAKLDSVTVVSVGIDGDVALVETEIRYLTALDWYTVTEQHHLVRRGGIWFLRSDDPDLVVPPDQLVRRSSVDYLIQGKRRVTSAVTESSDLQDRPLVAVESARLVSRRGQPYVVGEVANLDVDPAYVTVTAILRDSDGDELARYNATTEILHSLRPRQTTPFLIRFEDPAAGVGADFDPLSFTPLTMDDDIAEVEVSAKAVVTTDGLYSGLGAQHVTLREAADGMTTIVSGEIRNDGVEEALVPAVHVSYLDADGQMLWLETEYLERSIRSQRSTAFSSALADLSDVIVTDVPVTTYANSLNELADRELSHSPVLDLPPGGPAAGIRLDLQTFTAAS